MKDFTLFFLYALQSVVFFCIGIYFLVRELEFQKRRGVDPFLTITFLVISSSYLIFSLLQLWPDLAFIKVLDRVLDLSMIFYTLAFSFILLGSIGVKPFTCIYKFYDYLATKYKSFKKKIFKK